MTNASTPREVAEVEELVGLTYLEDVFFLEMSGVRRFLEEGDAPALKALSASDAQQFVSFSRVQVRGTDAGFDVRFHLDVALPEITGVIDVVTAYRLLEQVSLAPIAQQEFIEKVAAMAVWPFIREAVSDLIARLRATTVTLPLLRLGDVHLTKLAEDEAPTGA